MLRNLLNLAVFLVGLLAIVWIGAGYIGSNPLGFAVVLLIGVCYLAGALELYRYRQATATLQRAADDMSTAPGSLAGWLGRLHPSLRNAVRLRVEGERVALPAPVLTPYLVGLLVLLGMLGTLLGMMATLRGTGLALESATDLQAMRASLAAPVKGLGFAFGTSIAGVASSAMLGLLSALCRRERLDTVQVLDAQAALTLRSYSQAHQRDESLRLMQEQASLMPALLERMQAMMDGMAARAASASEQQFASQQGFHVATEATFARLAESVGQSLKQSVSESALAAGAAFQPVVEATMAGIARESAALHTAVTQAVEAQLAGLSSSFESNTVKIVSLWADAVDAQQRSNETLAHELRSMHKEIAGDLRNTHEAITGDIRVSHAQFADAFAKQSSTVIDSVSSRVDGVVATLAASWSDVLSKQSATNDAMAERNERALGAAATSFDAHASAWRDAVVHSHAELQAALESRDAQRLTAWQETLSSVTASLATQWESVGSEAAKRQEAICATLETTAAAITAHAQASAADTIAEISRLVDAAAEAPKVAAEVVAELRQKLSDSMVRDTAMLEERSRLMATLETLLDAVNHASTEQRAAVDALVATSADLLDRVGTRFIEHIEGETGKLGAVAERITEGASQVTALGEAFGGGVAAFAASNEALVTRLDQVASALDASLVRSDEQLAYYVAQAREVVDLSVLSQKQIIEDLQHLANQRVSDPSASA